MKYQLRLIKEGNHKYFISGKIAKLSIEFSPFFGGRGC